MLLNTLFYCFPKYVKFEYNFYESLEVEFRRWIWRSSPNSSPKWYLKCSFGDHFRHCFGDDLRSLLWTHLRIHIRKYNFGDEFRDEFGEDFGVHLRNDVQNDLRSCTLMMISEIAHPNFHSFHLMYWNTILRLSGVTFPNTTPSAVHSYAVLVVG